MRKQTNLRNEFACSMHFDVHDTYFVIIVTFKKKERGGGAANIYLILRHG